METLTAGRASVTIDHERGGRLSSLEIDGHELIVGADPDLDPEIGWGSFPMVPFAGRIANGRFETDGRIHQLPITLPPHAIHGTTHLQPWTQTGPGRLYTDLGPDWPWAGRVDQHFDLGDDRLDLAITVTADPSNETAMPVTAGWHPWFRRTVAGTDVELSLPAERMWRRDDRGIPDGTLIDPPPGPWDDCFTALVGPVELRWPGLLRLWVESDCEHVVVYDEQPHAVCVEPQSAPPDAHNSGEDLVEIEPGESWSVHATFAWQADI